MYSAQIPLMLGNMSPVVMGSIVLAMSGNGHLKGILAQYWVLRLLCFWIG